MIELRPGKQLVYYDGAEVKSPAQPTAAWNDNAYASYDADLANDLAGSYIDTSGNARNLPGTGVLPDHIPGVGWLFDGAQHLDTIIVPQLDQTWSAIVKFNGTGFIFGLYYPSPTKRFNMAGNYSNTSYFYQNGTTFITGPGFAPGTTVMAMAGAECYKDGIHMGTIPVSSASGPYAIAIGALASNSPPPYTYYLTGTIAKIGFWNYVLSIAEVEEKTLLIS